MRNAAKECNIHINIREKDWFNEECQKEIKEREPS